MKCILLADDNENDVQLIRMALSKLKGPHEIAVAHDGAEALDFLYYRGSFQSRPKENPTVILLDLKMPRVDGLEVLQQIKGDDSLKTIPVVMFTSSREQTDILKSYQLGVNAYVVKPVDFREFMQVVKDMEVFWIVCNEPPPESNPQNINELQQTTTAE
ncbi:MAG: response regulator [Verrucomicrobiota bacterium]